MEALSPGSGARTAFAERLALLYKEAGDPPLKRVAEAVVRLQRVDERGRPVRVSAQRISDWRRARNVPAQFAALAVVLHILIPEARRTRAAPVSPGLYDLAHWQRLWEHAVADPIAGEQPAPPREKEQAPAEAPAVPGGVCPYRGLASYRQQDARWFFGRERSTDALVAQLRAVEETGGLVMLVGASGAGKSSLLNAGLVPTLQDGALSGENGRARAVRAPRTGSGSRRGADPPDPRARAPVVSGADGNAVDARRPRGTATFGPAVRAGLLGLGATPGGFAAPPVVIVDQFEEAFTLCPDEANRRRFIQLLHAACTPADAGSRPPCSSSSAYAPTSTSSASPIRNSPTRCSTGTWCSAR